MTPKSNFTSEKYTHLHIAAVVGNTAAVEILVNRNPMLLYAEDVDGLLPVHRALINSHRETFLYLLDVTKDNQFSCAITGNMGVTLLSNVIFAGYFDVPLKWENLDSNRKHGKMAQFIKFDDMTDVTSSHSGGADSVGFAQMPKLHKNTCSSIFFC
ncbi:ankyrin repeat-containing domain, PGG domain, Gag-polypeptide of LTR copia-type [Artemisia annua]|uniref:Ankyrin repeat-containing domain, PGG domain, Gag-polypeptide of LTR copia-type n=1 Tax=Artemisia annua TaxID=35608 RepID=A0A2U1MEY3_ARTAN|nr:ankyrin repeat-containing domain, PGG domain, Gag-polypeptide of LTR copia-type [Artemisia annua]